MVYMVNIIGQAKGPEALTSPGVASAHDKWKREYTSFPAVEVACVR